MERMNRFIMTVVIISMVLSFTTAVLAVTPDIKANGSGNSITIGTSDTLSITVSISAGDFTGVNCDWWVAESAPDGWYYYSLSTSWTSAGSSYTGLSPTYQGALFDLGSYSVLNTSGLSVGTHTYYFAVDTNVNGTLDMDQIYFDSVVVNVAAGVSQFQILSSAFQHDNSVPIIYTCDDEDVSPPLQWSGAPSGTQSFVLLVEDPDAPAPYAPFYHWGVYDIPAEQNQLTQGIPKLAQTGDLMQAVNDFGLVGYNGPCPPSGHGVHHYHFQLLALDVASLGLTAGSVYSSVEAAANQHVIAEVELIGTYSR